MILLNPERGGLQCSAQVDDSRDLGWLLRHDARSNILDDPSFVTADGWAINDSRVVVGDYSDAEESVHGLTWTRVDGFTTLDFPNKHDGPAPSISAATSAEFISTGWLARISPATGPNSQSIPRFRLERHCGRQQPRQGCRPLFGMPAPTATVTWPYVAL